MVMPSLIGTDFVLHASLVGDQSGERVTPLSNGTALVTWNVAGSATPLQGRIVAANGTVAGPDLVFGGIGPGVPYAIGELPGGGFAIASLTGNLLTLSKYAAVGTLTTSIVLTVNAAVTGGPLIETTPDGTIGVYVRTTTTAQVGAFDQNLVNVVPFDTLFLRNGVSGNTGSATDADGSVWTVIDGAGGANGVFVLVTTRGTGSATVIQAHVISLATLEDVSGPITIASGAGVDVASFRMAEGTNGSFVASWVDGTSVRAQSFSAAGAQVGEPITIAANSPAGVNSAQLADGGVLVTWSDIIGGQRDVLGAVFSATGAPASGTFTINTGTAGSQTNTGLARLGGGDILVGWDSADGLSNIDVNGRLLSFDRPDAKPDSFTVVAGTATVLALTANDTDPNENTISVQSVGTAGRGTVVLANGVVTYTPNAGYTGADSFSYTLVDSTGRIDTATVTLSVQTTLGPALPLVRIDPVDEGAGVSVVSNVTLQFTGTVARGSGAITLLRADGSVVETFDAAASTRLSVSGNRLVIDPTAALQAGTGYRVTIAAGALSVAGVAYAGLSDYNFTTATAAAAAPQFTLLVGTGASASAAGDGQVFGTSGLQEIVVLDRPGRLTLDGSFNTGGDRIRLSGNAAEYVVSRAGATVTLSDGDTIVAVPIGTGGADIVFADGVRSLSADLANNIVRLGTQTVTTTAAAVTAPAATAVVTGPADAALSSQLIVNSGRTADAIGVETVFGTIAGAETVRVAPGGRVTLEGSFNAGGDVIVLSGTAASYTVGRSGATVTLATTGTSGETVNVPAGPGGATIRFADGDRALVFDQTAGVVRLGTQTVGVTAAPVTAAPAPTAASLDQDNDANLATQFTIDASTGSIRFTDVAATGQNVRLTGFGRGDSVVFQGPASDYLIGSSGSDIIVTRVGAGGQLSTTVFAGLAAPGVYVNSEASAELAAGFDFLTFTV